MKKLWKFVNLPPVIIAAMILACIALFVTSGLYFDWSKSDTASWVQAVGSILAIVGAFAIAENQQIKERKRNEKQEQKDRQDKEDDQLRRRTLTVMNLVQVLDYALTSATKLVHLHEGGNSGWANDAYFAHIQQLRGVLDSLISSETDHVAIVTALEISRMLTMLHYDLKNYGGAMSAELVRRSANSVTEAGLKLDHLKNIQRALVALCTARGLPIDRM